MVLMALGHALVFIGLTLDGEGLPGFSLAYPTPYHFLTRFLTHYAPTTFLFLAGASVIFASEHRKNTGKSEGGISFHFFLRGLVLIMLQFTVVNLAFSWGVRYYFGVLSMIGTVIMILSVLRLIPTIGLILLGCISFIIVDFVLNGYPFVPEGRERILSELLLYANVKHGALWVRYPIMPWLGVGLIGCAFGKAQVSNNEKTFRWTGILGVVALILFGVLRCANKFGNLRPHQGQGWIDFLVTSKYPPSICFLLWTLGGMAITLFLLNHFRGSTFLKSFPWKAVTLFGRVPLFFYVLHICLYRILSKVLGLPSELGWGYLLCILGLVILFPICRNYRKLRARYPRYLQYF
jgi:uncharacterized membrane protein